MILIGNGIFSKKLFRDGHFHQVLPKTSKVIGILKNVTPIKKVDCTYLSEMKSINHQHYIHMCMDQIPNGYIFLSMNLIGSSLFVASQHRYYLGI